MTIDFSTKSRPNKTAFHLAIVNIFVNMYILQWDNWTYEFWIFLIISWLLSL